MSFITERETTRIMSKYNPEYDIPPGPEVSWVEWALLQMVLELEKRIIALEEKEDK